MATKVKNLNGTGDRKAPSPYIGWLDYWKDRTNISRPLCSNVKCYNHAAVGAHVKKADSYDGKWYITPLCEKCNKKPSSEEFYVSDNIVPVKD